MHEVVKNEVIKLFDASIVYPISDSQWVSPTHMVPKKGGFVEQTNDDGELAGHKYYYFQYGYSSYHQVPIKPEDLYDKTFTTCLSNLDRVLLRSIETDLVLNWEKCHMMVNEGIILGHKISLAGIVVDR
ncbi:uncharacterized protein LOC127252634 [Andrographis paniculata]|uniref:uncharacterized protein LOC127252634 n=1 Tax=Andrographis paniculata TaxID=175694 RepID=UPI0021E96FB0|nr:uncharacterized protein LOC127252634 [Andrographis paniculata]